LLEDDEYNRSLLTVPTSRVAMKPAFASEEVIFASDIGTANHLFMQFCDFSRVDSSGVEQEAERLCAIRMISENQKKLLDFDSLGKFFKSELYSRMKNSARLYREKRFSVRDVIAENSEPVLIQGVIDCFFEKNDGTFAVVDYKTDRVRTPEELVKRHKIQLECYKRAVERMTGREVSEVIIYSFALGTEVNVDAIA
jgi:ATP-dependent helicase/nuclease subunit A